MSVVLSHWLHFVPGLCERDMLISLPLLSSSGTEEPQEEPSGRLVWRLRPALSRVSSVISVSRMP
ncbi:hypothetical protein D3C85_1790290 [compost metagenome]